MSDVEKQIRDDIYIIAKKYENKNNDHAKAIEFEADRYASNKTSEGDVKKALRERNKHKTDKNNIIKNIKNDAKMREEETNHPLNKKMINHERKNALKEESIKNQMTEQHKSDTVDYNARSKALKDKDMKKSNIYK